MKEGKFHNCQADVAIEGNVYRLRSYGTIVCDVNMDTKVIYFYPDYRYGSVTMQHVRKFLVELIGFYVPMSWVDSNIINKYTDYAYLNGYMVIMTDNLVSLLM